MCNGATGHRQSERQSLRLYKVLNHQEAIRGGARRPEYRAVAVLHLGRWATSHNPICKCDGLRPPRQIVPLALFGHAAHCVPHILSRSLGGVRITRGAVRHPSECVEGKVVRLDFRLDLEESETP